MSVNRIYAGMKIFAQYNEAFMTEAQHDVVFVNMREVEISTDDVKILHELGWDEDIDHKGWWEAFT